MIGDNNSGGGKPIEPRRDSSMQAAVAHNQGTAELPQINQILFDRFWEDVAPLNNFSPEAAQTLLARESSLPDSFPRDRFAADPWTAVRAALRERAAGRRIYRSA